jgi:hypothetical protein
MTRALLHRPVLDQRIDGDLVAMYDIEDTFGHARLEEQLGIPNRCRRSALRGSQHERVAARGRHHKHPARPHHREIERREPRN